MAKAKKAAATDKKITPNQVKILQVLKKHGEQTVADLKPRTGFEKGYSKAIGAAQADRIHEGSLIDRGYVKAQQYETESGASSPLYYTITSAGEKALAAAEAEPKAAKAKPAKKTATKGGGKTKTAKAKKASTKKATGAKPAKKKSAKKDGGPKLAEGTAEAPAA